MAVRDGGTKTPGVSPRGRRRSFVRWSRLLVQLVFLVLAPQAFSAAFSGARSIMVSVGERKAFDVTGLVWTLVILVVYTVAFGRFFCGYACSFGMLGDVVYQLAQAVRRRFHLKPSRLSRMSDATEDRLRYLKHVVLVAMLLLSLLGAGAVVSAVSPWTAFGQLSNLTLGSIGIVSLVILVILVILMTLRERVFCEFLCPLGALFSLLPVLPRSNRHRNEDDLRGSAGCKAACPVHIDPPGEGPMMGECIQCDRCETVGKPGCVDLGPALRRAEQVLERQGYETDERGRVAGYSKARDYRTRRVVILALVLLALLWLAGSARYLPASPLA